MGSGGKWSGVAASEISSIQCVRLIVSSCIASSCCFLDIRCVSLNSAEFFSGRYFLFLALEPFFEEAKRFWAAFYHVGFLYKQFLRLKRHSRDELDLRRRRGGCDVVVLWVCRWNRHIKNRFPILPLLQCHHTLPPSLTIPLYNSRSIRHLQEEYTAMWGLLWNLRST